MGLPSAVLHNVPAKHDTDDITNTSAVSGTTLSDALETLSSSGGSMSTVKSNGVQVGDADIVTLDFSSEFTVGETPNTEINISVNAITSSKVSDFSSAVVALLTDANIPNTITLDNITQITTRSHTSLSDIGTNTHSAIDTHIADSTIHFTQAAISITASQVSDFSEAVDDRVNALFVEGEGIDFVYSDVGNTFTVSGEDASTVNKGIASFNSADFSVSSGAVSILDSGIDHGSLGGLGDDDHNDATNGYVLREPNASVVDNTLVRWDSTTGRLIQESSVVLSDAEAMSGLTQLDCDNIRLDGNTISATSGGLNFQAIALSSFTFQSSAADNDLTFAFTGTTNSGQFAWMEDEDYFLYSDDIFMNSTEAVYFNSTANRVYQRTTNVLAIEGNTTTEVGKVGDIVLGDSTLRVMYPATTQKIDLGQTANMFNSVYAVNYYTDSASGKINYNLKVYAAGTVYSLTTSAALLDFGTTDPSLTIDKAGTYLLLSNVNLKYNAATFAANRTVTLKLRRTNNTAADITNSTRTFTTRIITTITDTAGVVPLPPVIYTTTNTNDIIQIFGSIDTGPTAGSMDAVEAEIMAIRMF